MTYVPSEEMRIILDKLGNQKVEKMLTETEDPEERRQYESVIREMYETFCNPLHEITEDIRDCNRILGDALDFARKHNREIEKIKSGLKPDYTPCA